MKKYDYIITGSGASGLLMAYRMANDEFFKNKSILILDKEKKKGNDRTWCFWENKTGEWEHLLDKQWDNILFDSAFYTSKIPILPYQYKMLRSSVFYKYLWKSVEKQENISFKAVEVKSIVESKQVVNVSTSLGDFSAKKVLNSILLDDHYKTNQKYPALAQHFVGWFIRTKENHFDDSVATFMDFKVPQKGNTRFMYILPFSKNYALFEYTLFSKDLLKKETYEEAIKTYLEDRNITDYIIEEKEEGVIPMSSYPFWKKNTEHILHVGTAGGWSRASTGFTFKNILKNTTKAVDYIKKEKTFKDFHKANKHWFYDLLLLDVLERDNSLGASIFAMLFRRNKIDKIFKFLDGETSFVEDVSIMIKMPKLKFIRALFNRIFK